MSHLVADVGRFLLGVLTGVVTMAWLYHKFVAFGLRNSAGLRRRWGEMLHECELQASFAEPEHWECLGHRSCFVSCITLDGETLLECHQARCRACDARITELTERM